MPLLRLECSSECYERWRTGPVGSVRSRHDVSVSRSPSRCSDSAGPRHFRFRVHPLLSLSPLQSSTCWTCTPRGRAPSMGFVSSFATSIPRVHLPTGVPCLSMFRPQRFSRSRRLSPLDTSRVCFIPQPRPRFTPQGVPPTVSRTDSSPARALLTFSPRACIGRTRCASSRSSPPGPCSDCRSVVTDELFKLAGTRSPLEFSLLQVFFRAPW